MRIPTVQGTIKRRVLVNYRADPAVVQALLPQPFAPKLHIDRAIVGICLIRLEHMRPSGMPGLVGVTSENAAHRIAIEWTDDNGVKQEGVYIPRRDTSSLFNRWAGGRLFPGEQHGAQFDVQDNGTHLEFKMASLDGTVRIQFLGEDADFLPSDSSFESPEVASAFFEGGSLGFSVTKDPGRLDALRLETEVWRTSPFAIVGLESTFFEDRSRFPKGTLEFDHALIMRNVEHEWRADAGLGSN